MPSHGQAVFIGQRSGTWTGSASRRTQTLTLQQALLSVARAKEKLLQGLYNGFSFVLIKFKHVWSCSGAADAVLDYLDAAGDHVLDAAGGRVQDAAGGHVLDAAGGCVLNANGFSLALISSNVLCGGELRASKAFHGLGDLLRGRAASDMM